MTNTDAVLREDRALEARSDKAGEALARHRWHWTLDESNPERMTFADYGRLVDRDPTGIARMAKAYVTWRTPDQRVSTRSLTDHIAAQTLSADREAAAQAIADARGVSLAHIAKNHTAEITSTVGIAQERAEREGTTVDEEVKNVAEWREKSRKAAKAEKEAEAEFKSRYGMEALALEGQLGAAGRHLREALKLAEDTFDDEEQEFLADTLGRVRSLLHLVELRLTGDTTVDWDAELARLTDA